MGSQVKTLLSEHNLTFQDILFSSERSCVLLVRDSEGEPCVLKVRKGVSEGLKKEASILQSLDHPNFAHVKGFFSTEQFTVLSLELIDGKCLVDIVTSKGPLTEQQVKGLTRQLVQSLQYLNEQNIVHLDLKPDNLMYNSDTGHLTVIDLETVIHFSKNKKHHEIVGTDVYQSPEVIKQSYYGPEAQNWSLGVTLYALLTADLPIWKKVKKNPFFLSGQRLSFPNNSTLSQECQDFLKKLLTLNPKKRATLKELMNHPWLSIEENQSEIIKTEQT